MGDPPWQQHPRRPHSAGGVSVETQSSRSRWSDNKGRTPMSRPVGRGELTTSTSTEELDFTDKLKALRELITSSKTRRHAREEHEKNATAGGARIVARRQLSFCEAKDVGEQVQFSVNSLERRRPGGYQARTRTDKEMIALEAAGGMFVDGHAVVIDGVREVYVDDDEVETELLLTPRGEKHTSPRRRSESYSHLLARDLKEMSLALERAWSASSLGDLSPESSPKRVTFRPDDHPPAGGGGGGGRRCHSSLEHFHHEVPERDWSLPTTTTMIRTLNSQVAENSLKTYRTEADRPVSVPALLLAASDLKARDLIREKDAIYKQFSPRESYAGNSPPEHDLGPSSGSTTPRPVQTNVQLTDHPSPRAAKARPRSADPVRRTSEKVAGSPRGVSEEDGRGHWTQLLSQKRERSMTPGRFPAARCRAMHLWNRPATPPRARFCSRRRHSSCSKRTISV
ncbi:uncharacterized protein LOC143302117 [Babylonia areolata]|uniref:uncharacterized protein LOC143302117 n=1 Tax=Babylonia areolata TaxID=304850 RepID=UPI003FD40FEC